MLSSCLRQAADAVLLWRQGAAYTPPHTPSRRSSDRAQVIALPQVTRRDSQNAAAARSRPDTSPPQTRATWRDRLRSLLCCLAPPATDQYYRSSENDAVVVRPPAPQPPPRGTQQHVLGPIAPQVGPAVQK